MKFTPLNTIVIMFTIIAVITSISLAFQSIATLSLSKLVDQVNQTTANTNQLLQNNRDSIEQIKAIIIQHENETVAGASEVPLTNRELLQNMTVLLQQRTPVFNQILDRLDRITNSTN